MWQRKRLQRLKPAIDFAGFCGASELVPKKKQKNKFNKTKNNHLAYEIPLIAIVPR
jgi:hypothetical protein